MQIYCPKCNTGYQIDEALIKDKSRRMKCSACGEVFVAASLKTENLPEPEEDVFSAISAAMSDSPVEQNVKEEVVYQDKASAGETSENISAEEIASEAPKEDTVSQPETKDFIQSTENDIVKETAEETVSDEIQTAVAEEIIISAPSEDNTPVNRDLGNGRIEPSFGAADDTPNEDEEDNVDLEKIFKRLSEHAEHLIAAEKKLPFYEKIWLQVKNALGFHFKIRWAYVFAGLAVFVLLSLYNNRYQIVRELPFLNTAYKALGIKAKVPGEGLEFQNVGWDYEKDEAGARLIVKGFVYNVTNHEIELPVVHVEVLDKQTSLLQSHNREMKENGVDAGAKIPLSLILENPAPTAKYVYLTFIDKD